LWPLIESNIGELSFLSDVLKCRVSSHSLVETCRQQCLNRILIFVLYSTCCQFCPRVSDNDKTGAIFYGEYVYSWLLYAVKFRGAYWHKALTSQITFTSICLRILKFSKKWREKHECQRRMWVWVSFTMCQWEYFWEINTQQVG
jgi:hypothetical protein